jgi:hypothetical protein
MSRRILPKRIPVVPSFSAWQKAAAESLTLETALARSKRAQLDPEARDPAELEASAARARVIADELFQIAFVEARLTSGKQQAPVAQAQAD